MSQNSLASTYSRALGLSLGRPILYQAPYPLPSNNYIVWTNGSGNPYKNYDYFQEVLDFLFPILKENNIDIIQLGGEKEVPLNGCLNLCGKTSLHQSTFIINNAKLVICNDTSIAHIAGALNIPLVAVYGPTSIENHGPHWKNDDKTILIESHRNGKTPSFSFNESPKTVNLIKPEEIFKAVSEILNFPSNSEITSLYFGNKYSNSQYFECVLDTIVPPQFIPQVPLHIRYDWLENPQNLATQLSQRKCAIITDKPIDGNLLKALKENILVVIYEVTDNNDPKFVLMVKSLGISISLYTKLKDEDLNKYKLDYVDIGFINQEKIYTQEDLLDSKEKMNENTYFKSNKNILSKGKFFLSKTHWLLDISKDDPNNNVSKVINTPKFFEELEYFYLFNKKDLT